MPKNDRERIIPLQDWDIHRTSRPVRARPMIMRWISEVPSKIVKFVGRGYP
jgi:hypothetical protein